MKHTKHFNLILIFLFVYAALAVAQTDEEYEEVTTTLDFASQANVYGIESKVGNNDSNPNPTEFKVNDIAITLTGRTLLYGITQSHYLRIDNDSKENGAITFSCPSGITINKITFTAANNKIALTPPKGKEITCNKAKSCYWENSKKITTPLTFSTNNAQNSYIAKIQILYTRPKINVTLKEKDTSISEIIKQNIGETHIATERIFHNNGKNTVCLPFNITLNGLKEVFGDGTQAAVYSGSDDESISFSTVKSGTITAGMPFILIPGMYVENPTFYNINLKDEEAKEITFGNISFCGTYSPYDMQTDGTELFLNSSQELARPKDNANTMRGLRAFFRIENNDAEKFNIQFNEDTSATHINKETISQQKGNAYSIDGKKLCKNISNGKERIVILERKKFLLK